MPLLAFLFEAGIISLSGVMAPGPITTVVIGKGNSSPHAGALVTVGHSLVEIPLMVAVFFGIGRLLDLPYVKPAIAAAGGLFLLVMAVAMLQGVHQQAVRSQNYSHSSIMAGVLLTLVNPYFLVWWATVGATLISRSIEFGLIGFLAFAILHSFCDLGWNYSLSTISFKGGQFFGHNFQRGVFLVCGILLLVFGARLVWDGVYVFIGA
jgi:threonine/homoserine/homoserine lactone efflux protein